MSEKKEIAVMSDIHGNHIALKRCVELALSRDIRTFYFLGDYAGELACPERTMEYHGKCVWNPGSVGVPLYSEGKTQFMILHGSDHGWFPEFISLDYDVDKVIGELYESGMDRHAPYWCRVTENLLRRGDMPHGVVLERVMKLCAAETGSCTWPDLPERFWKQAAEELLEG